MTPATEADLMAQDIDLYIDSKYAGFFPLEEIEERFEEYEAEAYELSRIIDWDEIILYAIFSYDEDTQATLSADLMMLRMPYEVYQDLCMKLSKNCRLFFLRNREEFDYEV
ncbi:MAG TPA: hypothetical protein PLH83_00785 [Ruminococcus sp.]|nr:hypothetical protein [Ruminococcus sp.]